MNGFSEQGQSFEVREDACRSSAVWCPRGPAPYPTHGDSRFTQLLTPELCSGQTSCLLILGEPIFSALGRIEGSGVLPDALFLRSSTPLAI